MEIERKSRLEVVNIDTAANIASCTALSVADATSVAIQLPSGSGTTQIDIYASIGGLAYGHIKDAAGTLQSITCSALVPQSLPDEVFKWENIKLIAGAGAATANVPAIVKS